MPSPLYSEVVDEARARPYGNTRRKSAEINYLRKARIPHWEWKGYSSRESSVDDGNEDTFNREIPEPGGHLYPEARETNKRYSANDKRQEASKAAAPKRAKRPNRRVKSPRL